MGFYKTKRKVKKIILELKISGSGINEGSANFEVLTNKGLKLR